jgi:hypothetical protein
MNAWLQQWYTAQASNGGVIRRNRDDVERFASVAEVVADARERGWHVVETGGQVVIFCHDGDMRIWC